MAGGSFVVDGVSFSGWIVDDASTVPPDIAAITLVPLDDQPARPGFRVLAGRQFGNSGLELLDLQLYFAVAQSVPGLSLADAGIVLEEHEFGGANVGGFIGITGSVYESAAQLNLLAQGIAFADNLFGVDEPEAWIDFAPRAALFMRSALLVSGDDPDDQSTLASFSQRFTVARAVSEPPVGSSLAAAWLAWIAGYRLRRRR